MPKSPTLLTTATVVAFFVIAPALAQDFVFKNGAAFHNWQASTQQGIPAPAPFVIVDGITYRLGDKGVQFHRYPAGGVRVILGSCTPETAHRTLALEFYSNGAFSELLDCDEIDGNHSG